MAVDKRKAEKVAKRYWPFALAGFVVLTVAAAWLATPASDWIGQLSQSVKGLGAWGALVYVLLYVVGAVVLAPSPLISIAAGAMFGWWGLPLAVLGATAGATASFTLSRYFFDDTLEDWLTDRPAFHAIKQAVDEESWRVVVPLRLSPAIPFTLLNYMLGLSRMSFASYVVSTAIGILPGSIVDVYLGVVGTSASLHDPVQLALLVVGLIATATVAALITIKARAYLREEGVKV